MYFVDENSLLFHLQTVTVIIGQLFISIIGGIGLIFLPYNLLNDYIFRPKPLNKVDFQKR